VKADEPSLSHLGAVLLTPAPEEDLACRHGGVCECIDRQTDEKVVSIVGAVKSQLPFQNRAGGVQCFCLFIEQAQQGWRYFAALGWCCSPPFLFPFCVPVPFIMEMPVALSCDLCASWFSFSSVSFALSCLGL